MKRRDFVRLGGATMIAAGTGKPGLAFAQAAALQQAPGPPQHPIKEPLEPKATGRAADFTLRIAPMMVELAPQVVISTIGYSNKVPGPLVRVREGQPVTVDVVNDTDVPEYVHWHGLLVPSKVDGAEEEGTPPVPPHGRRRYQFVAKPAGSRWYHSHTAAMMDLHRGAYTGQFGFFLIDSANDPGLYDQEVFLALREWQYFLSTMDQDEMAADPNDPMPEKPATPDLRPNGLEVSAPLYSINDKILGAGDPLRVQRGQRILMHLLNASAAQIHRVALPGHKFQVIALDGNSVPAPQPVDVIEIAPGERVDAIVEMNQPGVWILGELRNVARQSGMGIVVEYANPQQPPVLAVVGDVSCQPSEAEPNEPAKETCSGDSAQNLYASQAATAQQIENLKPAVIALVGDEQYQVGQYSDFENSYELTYGAFKMITRPAPGNHEFYTEHGAIGVAG
jgi:FtsP/CotA-like multicopper oxidase with cupredoxin domain